ncbi:uncharacterized protein F4822DRAFT_96579 [Hypoxylon trugodes]|uniref:uncharacterized protein n=1 Tax=Hypoxylon trugodes TaxID=326681 RepID=UPI00219F14D8|nr:uncharacterized protein F4822DRAFT_96579 [Hypoxylon trugodes]KAI1382781.1 hypothetical protein F4822DRAFT_96579 [Hypoxylon trugodes]
MTTTPFPDLPKIGVKFPHSPISIAAFAYTKEHTTELIYNHCVRSAYWALLLARKLPEFSSSNRHVNLEIVVLANILHDMGWATTKEILSEDKRFEVDGADLAHEFVRKYAESGAPGAEDWKDEGESQARVRLVWDAIALHATGSIAQHHPAREVALAHMGVIADLTGPLFPAGELGAVITVAEYKEVVSHFPLVGWSAASVKGIMCGLCRDKPASTYDNFAAGFGALFGFDGEGNGREEYLRARDAANPVRGVVSGLEFLEGLMEEDTEGQGERNGNGVGA